MVSGLEGFHCICYSSHHVLFSSCINSTNLSVPMQHWTRLNITTDKLPPRNSHATCCIESPLTGQQHPLLMVVGGYDLGDVWLLDLDKGVWSEVGMSYVIV